MGDVLKFLKGENVHPSGKTVSEWRAADDIAWENTHDVIQWMFPTMRPSKAQPHSPYLTVAEVHAIRKDAKAVESLRDNKERYFNFLYSRGLIWRVSRNHNHLRITRVIESLSLLIGSREAATFLEHVNAMCLNYPINDETRKYWQNAVDYGKEVKVAPVNTSLNDVTRFLMDQPQDVLRQMHCDYVEMENNGGKLGEETHLKAVCVKFAESTGSAMPVPLLATFMMMGVWRLFAETRSAIGFSAPTIGSTVRVKYMLLKPNEAAQFAIVTDFDNEAKLYKVHTYLHGKLWWNPDDLVAVDI